MNKIFIVAQREFLATVRTRAFILTVVLMPALIIAATYGGKWVRELGQEHALPDRHLAVIDPTGAVFTPFEQQIAAYNGEHENQVFVLDEVPAGTPGAAPEALAQRVRAGELYGYLILAPNVLTSDPNATVFARTDSQLEAGSRLERMLNEAVYAARLAADGIDYLKVQSLRKAIPLERVDAATAQKVSDNEVARILTPFAFMFLLFMGTFGISQHLLTSVIEEKSSRVMEVLLSAVSPLQLMAGKIIGTALVGFLLIAVWGGVGYYSAQEYNLANVVTPYRLGVAVLYFIPGFLLIAALLAGIGAACNELKEAQSMVFPLSILTIVPMVFWFYLAEYPSSIFSVALSYIPPITPFVMVLRVCADPHTALLQIITTQALLWVSVFVAVWVAAKIFRIGVLMYGKPPSPRELLRWIRQA